MADGDGAVTAADDDDDDDDDDDFCMFIQIYTNFTFSVYPDCLNSVSHCAGMAVGQYPDCSDCTMFYKCTGSSGGVFICPSSLFYDYVLGVCSFPGMAACGYNER